MSNSQQDKSKSSGKAKEEPSYVETYASQARLGIPGADHAVKGSYWPLEDYNGPSKWEYPTTYPGRIPKDFKLETSNAYGVLEDMTQNAARSKDPRDTAIDNATSYALNRPAELSPAEQARLKEMADEQALSEATEARQREIGKSQQARLAARGTHEMRASIDRDLKQASSVLAASILKARLKYQQQGSNSSAWAASKDGAATIKNLTEAIDSFQTLESERQLQGDDQTKRTCFKSSYLDHTPLTMLRMIKANSKPIQDRNGGDCFLQLHKADDHSLCAVEMGLWGEAWLDKILRDANEYGSAGAWDRAAKTVTDNASKLEKATGYLCGTWLKWCHGKGSDVPSGLQTPSHSAEQTKLAWEYLQKHPDSISALSRYSDGFLAAFSDYRASIAQGQTARGGDLGRVSGICSLTNQSKATDHVSCLGLYDVGKQNGLYCAPYVRTIEADAENWRAFAHMVSSAASKMKETESG